MLKTAFWKKAAASLPVAARVRHMSALEHAERWELALDRAIETLARIKAAFTGHTTRAAH
jgi:hypothetical protein